MASKGETCNKSLILKPEVASFLDLFRILFSSEIESKEFIECIQVKEKFLQRRWVIFLSVFVQKAMEFIAEPLSGFGLFLERCLNLPSSNTNFGKVVMPDKESASFVSFIGNLDKRVDLDRNIKPGDGRYFAALSAMASKIVYENKAFVKATVEDRWKMELLGAYDFWNEYQQKNSTQALILHDKNTDPDMIIVAFRGTEPFDADAWCTDFDISWYKFQGAGKVHSGFMKALGLQTDKSWPQKLEQNRANCQLAYYAIREKLRSLFQVNSRTKFILTGHSLGGALAAIFPAILALHKEKFILERLEAVYTFGQPRVGNEKFGEFMKKKFEEFGVKYCRFVYNNDIVPRVPFDNSALMFKHFGTCIYFDSLYQEKMVSGDLYEKYFSPLSFVTRKIDAIWELVRSFIMPCIIGLDYRENSLLHVTRSFGLLLPGLTDHGPQDYVNATRLGKYSHLFEIHQVEIMLAGIIGK